VIFFGRWIGFTMEAQPAPQMEEEIDFDDLFQ
jgi:hypothetical protein